MARTRTLTAALRTRPPGLRRWACWPRPSASRPGWIGERRRARPGEDRDSAAWALATSRSRRACCCVPATTRTRSRRWLACTVLCDLSDVAATLAAPADSLPANARWGTVALAGGAAAGGCGAGRGGQAMRIAIVGHGHLRPGCRPPAPSRARDHRLRGRATTLGGHTNTVRVDLADETHWVDTGFIVLNDRNYPNFEPLLAELGVATQPSHMSFSVSDGGGASSTRAPRAGCSPSPRHALDPRFLRMIRDLLRFNREARALLELAPGEGPSLREFLDDGRLLRLVRAAADRAPGLRGVVGRARADVVVPGRLPRPLLPQPRHARLPRPAAVAHGDRRLAPLRGGDHAPVRRPHPPERARARGHPRTTDGVEVARRRLRDRALRRGGDRRALRPGAGHAHRPQRRASARCSGAIAYQPNEAVLHTDESAAARAAARRGRAGTSTSPTPPARADRAHLLDEQPPARWTRTPTSA